MKKFLLLLLVIITAESKAQQKELDSLLNELKKHPQEDTVRLNLLYLLAMTYYYTNPVEGIKKSDEGISLARKLNNEVKLGNAISSKGCNYMAEGKYDSCLVLLKTALHIFEKDKYERGASATLNIIGIVQFNTGDYAGALNTFSKNLAMAEQVHNTSQMIGSCGNLGMVFRAVSNYSEALTYDLRAIDLAEKSNNNVFLADACGEAGFTYRKLKQADKAKQYYQKALNICIQTGNERDEAAVLSALGQISSDEKKYQPALSYYQQALQVSKSTDNVQTETETLGNIGDVYKNTSDFSKALDYYKKALEGAQKLGDKNNIAYLLGEIGDMYTKTTRQQNQALSYLQQSLSIAKAIGSLERQQTTLNYLSSYYETQKNYAKALDYNKLADTLQNSIINYDTLRNITHLEMQYEFTKTQDSIKAVTDKQQALAKAEIQKQHVVEASMLAGTIFLMIAGVGSFLFYKRNRNIKAQKNEALLQSQITDTEMKALRAQMNPHFIFNSLNSIADYIHNNQTKMASDFTIKFARLMRMVLENSENKEISLAKDLKALELYMQLESFRLQNKFDYNIQVDENIDTENTLVPPLILQPFVENSIKHGLANKEGKGHLTIRIQQSCNMLNCIVEDNGEGMKETTGMERKSLGMRITGARIDVINKLKNAGASMNVSNKKEGVIAEVRLPLELSF